MGHFDKIFDEIECDGDPDEYADIKFTSYPATATRTGTQWTVTVHNLPEGRAVAAQGAFWAEARRNTHAAIVALLGVDPVTVGVHMISDDPEVDAAIMALIAARTARADAEQAEREAATQTARMLVDKGWTTRDAGGILSLSPQRISQLAPQGAA
jgi:hypothetical protein